MTRSYSQMDPHDALYRAARAYPGGISALAHRMDMSEAVLRNKLAPGIYTHHITLAEFSLILEYLREAKCDDAAQPLQALNWQHGLIAHQVPATEVYAPSAPLPNAVPVTAPGLWLMTR